MGPIHPSKEEEVVHLIRPPAHPPKAKWPCLKPPLLFLITSCPIFLPIKTVCFVQLLGAPFYLLDVLLHYEIIHKLFHKAIGSSHFLGRILFLCRLMCTAIALQTTSIWCCVFAESEWKLELSCLCPDRSGTQPVCITSSWSPFWLGITHAVIVVTYFWAFSSVLNFAIPSYIQAYKSIFGVPEQWQQRVLLICSSMKHVSSTRAMLQRGHGSRHTKRSDERKKNIRKGRSSFSMFRRPSAGHSWTYTLSDFVVLTFGSAVEQAMNLLSRKWRWVSVANRMRRAAVWIDAETAVSPSPSSSPAPSSFLPCVEILWPLHIQLKVQWSLPWPLESMWHPCSSLCLDTHSV